MPVLVYWALVWASPSVAYYMGLACIVSLSPFTYIKFFYPDQVDIFFNLLAITLLIRFLSCGRFRLLDLFYIGCDRRLLYPHGRQPHVPGAPDN